MKKFKITKTVRIGNSEGVAIPKEFLKANKLSDAPLEITEINGGIFIHPMPIKARFISELRPYFLAKIPIYNGQILLEKTNNFGDFYRIKTSMGLVSDDASVFLVDKKIWQNSFVNEKSSETIILSKTDISEEIILDSEELLFNRQDFIFAKKILGNLKIKIPHGIAYLYYANNTTNHNYGVIIVVDYSITVCQFNGNRSTLADLMLEQERLDSLAKKTSIERYQTLDNIFRDLRLREKRIIFENKPYIIKRLTTDLKLELVENFQRTSHKHRRKRHVLFTRIIDEWLYSNQEVRNYFKNKNYF